MVLVVKTLPADAGDARDLGLITGLGRSPWHRKEQSTSVFLPGEVHRQRSLVDCGPWESQRVGCD